MAAEWTSRSEEETRALGVALGRAIDRPAYLGLTGEMGAGKTAFVKGLAEGLGVPTKVVSPTFQLVREHEGRLPLFHFDFYRIGKAAELAEIDFSGCAERGVTAAEWADRFSPGPFDNWAELAFAWLSERERKITLTGGGGPIADALRALAKGDV